MIVVADTSPLNYLVLIDEIQIVPLLYDRVFIPTRVFEELQQAGAPEKVRTWVAAPPVWLQMRSHARIADAHLARLDAGERDAIPLAEDLPADKILIDEAPARREASRRGLAITGTLGGLLAGAEKRLLDLGGALERLRQTNFRVSPTIWDGVGKRQY
jgi:predicted nucleic acid-binding protein